MPIESVENTYNHQEQINLVFANCNKEDVIYLLTVREITQAQKNDVSLNKLNKHSRYSSQLVEDIEVLCKDRKIAIPAALQNHAVSWCQHYLQHHIHTRLEETLHAALYWKGMRCTIWAHIKNCYICQVNKQHKHQYGKLPAKLVITHTREVIYVDLVGPYTLRGKDGIEIDFIHLTMIDKLLVGLK
jgi:citrate synthase